MGSVLLGVVAVKKGASGWPSTAMGQLTYYLTYRLGGLGKHFCYKGELWSLDMIHEKSEA